MNKKGITKSSTSLSFSSLQDILYRRIQGLDSLRGIAILWVVWHNSLAGFKTTGLFSKVLALFTNTGWVGVQLFFVISGFLITGILIEGKKHDFPAKNFYIRRFLRIFPLYYIFLFLFFVILPLAGASPVGYSTSSDLEIYYWTFTINWVVTIAGVDGLSHFWSLAVEEQFYLLWPLLVLKLSNRSVLVICLIFIVIAIMSRFGMAYLFPDIYEKTNYKFTIARIDALSIGAILAIVIRNIDYYNWFRQRAFSILVVSLFLLLLMLVLNKNLSPVATPIGQLNQTLFAIISALSIYYLIQPGVSVISSWWHKFTSLKWLNRVGKYSFAIYIFHMPILLIFKNHIFVLPDSYDGIRWLLSLIYNFASVFILSYILAFISWHLIELPFLRLKKIFSYD